MFVAIYESGVSAYFVVDGKVGLTEEYRAVVIAEDRQQQGQLPPGTITRVKRVR